MSRKSLSFAIVLVLVAVVGLGFWWFETSTRPPAVESPPALVPPVPLGGGPGMATPVVGPLNVRQADAAAPGEEDSGMIGGTPESPGRPTVGDILAEPGDDFLPIAKKLAALVADPKVPMEEREEALAHTLNLSVDHEAEVLTPLVKDTNVPDALAESILAEALNRSLAYQADLYLAALPVRKSPEMQTLIREHLAFLTNGEDRGPNPADWAADIRAAKAEWQE